ncbi:ATPase inhibitor, mitochondrial [Podarcis muralis]|uniref:ATPase inhibitor, mitochondrial n=1 Tax=Podarcis muralis TaxID=64176 RepID=UPI0010A029C8|nr:ATPase inhibitor, mitochondrial [Podarcis muralis]
MVSSPSLLPPASQQPCEVGSIQILIRQEGASSDFAGAGSTPLDKGRLEMAAVGSVLRCGFRGALALPQQQRAWSSGADQLGELGKGAGKGGGGGGTVREAGGAFGKREAAMEERYFREKEREQLAELKKHHEDEIQHQKKEIERLQKEIERHKYKLKKLTDDD